MGAGERPLPTGAGLRAKSTSLPPQTDGGKTPRPRIYREHRYDGLSLWNTWPEPLSATIAMFCNHPSDPVAEAPLVDQLRSPGLIGLGPLAVQPSMALIQHAQ